MMQAFSFTMRHRPGVKHLSAGLRVCYWPLLWWPGLRQQVAAVVQMCGACDRGRQSFNRPHATLSPLSIRGLLYRWSIDEMVAIPGKESAIITLFWERVVGRYGCCAEVVSDGGGEFRGAFDALLSSLFIDHRTTSANHPHANGLAERAVQTLKRAIRKHSETAKEDSVWDMAVPYIMLGCNSSIQASTGLSPYEVMYGVPPTVPPAIRERYEGAIELDDPATAVVVVLRRAQALRECCIITGDNMLIAEHHDTVQYAEVRSGSYDPTTMHRIAPIHTAPHKNHSAKYCAAPHHTTPYHTAPHRTAQCRIKLHRIVPHRNASHRKRICTVMQRNAT